MILFGWFVIFGATMLFWSYSSHYAPTKEIRMNVATRDGASRVFSFIFGWLPAAIILILMETFRYIAITLDRKLNTLAQKEEFEE